MGDPYQCLRCSAICVGVYNLIYCIVQYGILGWQVSVVKERQWEYENRQLPATGFVDGFQARFPGLYAIYTETPERRRVNGEVPSRLMSFSFFDRFRRHESSAMFAIVLICLFLAIVHFMTTTVMLYGVIKRRPGAILPFFFTGIPITIMCTAYAVLWWSGDIFNEQLTMSVTEFVLSLAINSICIVVVMFYYYRLTGQLTSDKPRQKPPFHTNYWNYPNDAHREAYEKGTVPPWRTEWKDEPPWTLERKLRRRERYGTPVRPITGFKQKPPQQQQQQQQQQGGIRRQSWTRSFENISREYPSYPIPQPRMTSTPVQQQQQIPIQMPMTVSQQPMPQARPQSRQTRSSSSPVNLPPQTSIRNYEEECEIRRSQRRTSKRRKKSQNAQQRQQKHEKHKQALREEEASKAQDEDQQEFLRRKSPQRVSFTKRAPKVYERTPESSISSRPIKFGFEKHSIV